MTQYHNKYASHKVSSRPASSQLVCLQMVRRTGSLAPKLRSTEVDEMASALIFALPPKVSLGTFGSSPNTINMIWHNKSLLDVIHKPTVLWDITKNYLWPSRCMSHNVPKVPSEAKTAILPCKWKYAISVELMDWELPFLLHMLLVRCILHRQGQKVRIIMHSWYN